MSYQFYISVSSVSLVSSSVTCDHSRDRVGPYLSSHIMSLIPGSYQVETKENFDGYMRAAGFNEEEIHKGLISQFINEISEADGIYTFRTISNIQGRRVKEYTFQLGKEFHEVSMNGREVMSTITLEGERKLVHRQIAVKKPGNRFNKDVVWTRYFDETGMYMECECEGETGRLTFKRL